MDECCTPACSGKCKFMRVRELGREVGREVGSRGGLSSAAIALLRLLLEDCVAGRWWCGWNREGFCFKSGSLASFRRASLAGAGAGAGPPPQRRGSLPVAGPSRLGPGGRASGSASPSSGPPSASRPSSAQASFASAPVFEWAGLDVRRFPATGSDSCPEISGVVEEEEEEEERQVGVVSLPGSTHMWPAAAAEMTRSGHGTPRSVSSATSYYDQDEDDFVEERVALSDAEMMGSVVQDGASPAYFRETASSKGRSSQGHGHGRRSKKQDSRSRRSSSGAGVGAGASPRAGEVLDKLQQQLQVQVVQLESSGMNKSVPAHKVVNMEEVDAEGAGAEKRPLLVLEFQEITYAVRKKRQQSGSWWRCGGGGRNEESSSSSDKVVLLQEVSGEARDGEILAVMGPSGSGKSTLIDALAQRIARERVEGSITLNGEAVSNRLLRSISAYVMQDDLLFPMLTVQETLMFSADVRLPASQSRAKKRARVGNLLDQLGLRRVADTIIGDEGHRGVSGGERRRVSIGIDIIHDPLLLFLDEPTSGLDSTSAYLVVRTLQRIAHTGSIVILSIHQPSYRILGLLDRLILLAHGHKVYGGPPAAMGAFFRDLGRPIPAHENSTEFALDLIAELHAGPGGIKPLVQFYKSWSEAGGGGTGSGGIRHATDVRGAIAASISRGKLVATRASFHLHHTHHEEVEEGDDETTSMVVKFANPWYCEIPVLIRRTVINIRRTPELFLMRLATVVLTGFLLATVFWGLDHSPRGVQERLGFFAFAMSTTYYTCADALPVFLQERYIFMRETAHNAYRKSSYVLANAIIYIPFLALLSMAFALVIWWAVGLSGGAQGFLFFFLIIWASFWAGNSFVTFLSAVVPNVMLGYTVVVAMLAYFLLLSGFFIARNRIPRYWLWFHYLSIIKYPYEAVLMNEFQRAGPASACFETGAQILYGTPLAGLPAAAVADMLAALGATLPPSSPYKNLNLSSCVTDGSVVLRNQYVTQLGKWACLGVTVAFGVLFRLCFYVVLRLGGKNTRH